MVVFTGKVANQNHLRRFLNYTNLIPKLRLSLGLIEPTGMESGGLR